MYNPVLKIFVTVADCGSFNKAAESLYLSSTAIMKQMNLFENHIGLQLFNRTPRGVQLTEAGKSLYKDARLMMQRSEEAIENAYRAGAMQRRTIRVGTSALYPCKSLIELWNKINGDHPQFKLKVVPFEDTHTDGVRREMGKNFDVLYGVFDSSLSRSYCRFLELGQYHFCVAMSGSHRLASKRIVSLEDLYGEQLMIQKSGNSPTNDCIRRDIEKGHTQIHIVDTPYHYDIGVFNDCEENGCVLLTLENWHDIHPSLVTVPFDVPYTIPHGIIYGVSPNEDTQAFIEIVQNLPPSKNN